MINFANTFIVDHVYDVYCDVAASSSALPCSSSFSSSSSLVHGVDVLDLACASFSTLNEFKAFNAYDNEDLFDTLTHLCILLKR